MTVAIDAIVRDTWNTVSPVRCAGCGRPDTVCCPACQAALVPRVHHPTLAIRRALFDVPVVAGTHYEGVVKRVVTMYKERGVVAVDRYLAQLLRAGVRQVSAQVSLEGAVVVCVPHSRSGWTKRGRHPTRHLVKTSGWGSALTPARALHIPRATTVSVTPASQKNRSRRERLNTPPTFVGGADVAGRRVLLVDDVLTTGISLEYAARAINFSGGIVVGAVVVAATPPRTQKFSM